MTRRFFLKKTNPIGGRKATWQRPKRCLGCENPTSNRAPICSPCLDRLPKPLARDVTHFDEDAIKLAVIRLKEDP